MFKILFSIKCLQIAKKKQRNWIREIKLKNMSPNVIRELQERQGAFLVVRRLSDLL